MRQTVKCWYLLDKRLLTVKARVLCSCIGAEGEEMTLWIRADREMRSCAGCAQVVQVGRG
jgi:hypothetical protein